MPSCSPIRPAVSESRIKRITQIARITPHRPTTCAFPSRPYPAALRARPRRPTVSESRIKRITRITRITPPPNHRFFLPIRCVLRTPCRHSPIPPAPVIRFAHCRLRLCLRGKGERMAFLKVCIQGCFDGFGRMDHAIEPQTPLAQSLAQPLAIPPSSQAGGQGVGPPRMPYRLTDHRSHRHFTA